MLVVTGGLHELTDRSVTSMLARQLAAFRHTEAGWLDLHIKTLFGSRVLALTRHAHGLPASHPVQRMLASPDPWMPELTEVVLTTALRDVGIDAACTTVAALLSDRQARNKLDETDHVFVSTTLLRDESELDAVLSIVRRPHNRVVVGGALTGLLGDSYHSEAIDVLALGYGEWLVEALVPWLRGGEPGQPQRGSIERWRQGWRLRSGAPGANSLDELPTPDWRLAEQLHGRRFPVISYESVRGCPFRCAFCNYPYLFDDTKFRRKSAERIARDWLSYAEQGVQTIVCLDSLFTVPRKRLLALCDLLIDAGSPIGWVCYARADDLVEPEVCDRMARAGCIQVQIGVESGSQAQLDNMNKQTTVGANRTALRNLRDANIPSMVSLIVGFPGETEDTLEQTRQLMHEAPPDFFYAAPFSVKFPGVPVLSPEARQRFGLVTLGARRAPFPGWRHATMDAMQAVHLAQQLSLDLAREGVALDAAFFHGCQLAYQLDERQALLDFQRSAYGSRGLVGVAADVLTGLTARRGERELRLV